MPADPNPPVVKSVKKSIKKDIPAVADYVLSDDYSSHCESDSDTIV